MRCGAMCEPDEPDPCLGKLPGVIFACCGHGEGDGYITFANNVTIRFDLDQVEAPSPSVPKPFLYSAIGPQW